MKRKQHSELRCNPINIQLSRSTPKTSLFGVQKLQSFFPPIECLFKTECVDKVSEYGIKFPDVTINGETATTPSGEIALHPKITMLLNPYKWMKGINLELPSSTADATEIRNKLQSAHNAAYVGSLFNAVFSLSKCHHFPRVVGVYSGVAQEFKLDISDDYEGLTERPWFSRNVGKTFTLQLESSGEQIQYTRTARLPLDLGDEVELEDIQELAGIASDATVATEFQKVFEEEDVTDSDSDSDISTAYIFDIESVSEYSLDEEEEEEFAWATFKNVPVQLTLMEKLEGTFYELVTQIPDPSKWYAWLFQITFALAFAQRNFGFTHNDLHGNNVMYVRTNHEYFYYTSAGTSYKVPTHGYLLKLIDFDRGIGYVRLPGMKEPRLFMSDQFEANNEAGGQYNMQPFFKESFPVVKPNPSFDLVRLATSMFWDLYPDGPEGSEYQNDRVFKLFMKWMTLEDGTSVLFHAKNPKLDRYYGFSLYKAIARYCKDVIPRKELAEFTEFVGQIPAGELPLVLDP